jgi:hypothetical protein
MKQLSLIIFLAITFLSQADTLSPSVSQDSFFIGDRITYSVAVRVPHGASLIPPAVDNGFGQFSIKGISVDTGKSSSADTFRIHYTLATYTVEQCTIPSQHFYIAHDSVTDTLPTKEVVLRYVPLPGKDTGEIRDLKPQQVVGKPPLLWLWILLAVALGAGAWYAGKRWVHRRTTQAESAISLKPPYEEAMDALTALEAKNYYAQGKIREYVFELSELLKRYITRRFEVNATELTTEEILDWIRTSAMYAEPRRIADWFFVTTDPIKFAKWVPDNATFLKFGADIRAFLELTKPLPEVPGKKPEADNAV